MKTTRLFTLFAALALTISAYAYDFQSGDLYYNITSSTAPYTVEVTYKAVKYSAEITTPSFTNAMIPTSVRCSYNNKVYSVTRIGKRAFHDCFYLTSVTIPNTVTAISDSAFHSCSSLTSITIPSSVNFIGIGAFEKCPKLSSVNIPAGITSISNSVFKMCSSLTSVTIPEGVTSIGNSAFQYCSSLTSITLPEGVTSIGNSAFHSCSSLTSITIPESVTNIGDYVFYSCTNLASITIPESVTSIGNSAFHSCSSLTSITIPESVTNISSYAFERCTGLVDVSCRSVTPPTLATAFPQNTGMTLKVPCGAVETYKTTTNWQDFKTIVDDDFVVRVSPVNYIQGFVTNSRVKCRVESIKAIPRSGFVFLRWNDGNTQNPRTINLTSDTAFVAYFKVVFRVNVQVNNSEMGQVTGEGLYDENSEATITAVPKTGYHFVAWNDQNTDNPRTVNVTTDSTFTATFAINTYSVSGSANDANMGQVTGGKVYEYNTQATIVAVANEGYGFVQWNDGNTHNPRTFTVTSDSAFVATFDAKYTISVTSADAVMGTVVGSGKFMNNTQTTIEATPNDGYAFVQWNDLYTENPRTILVTGDATYTATFMTITAIEQVTAEMLNLRIENGTILCDGVMHIYDLIGRDVTHQNGLLQGVYMVRVDNLVVKVMVK